MANLTGRNLRRLREKKKLSQGALAKQLGISPQALSAIEVGRRGIGPAMREKLVAALDIDPGELYHSDPATTVPKSRRKPPEQHREARNKKLRLLIETIIDEWESVNGGKEYDLICTVLQALKQNKKAA